MSMDDEEKKSEKSMSPRSSFIDSESDRSIFSRAQSQGDSMM
jgi:hypothetical protein